MVPDLPVTTGLKGMHIQGGNAALSIRNLADSTTPLTMVGTPTISPPLEPFVISATALIREGYPVGTRHTLSSVSR